MSKARAAAATDVNGAPSEPLPSDDAPVAWRWKLGDTPLDPEWVVTDVRPTRADATDIQRLVVHPEDAPLKKTPENLHSGEAIKAAQRSGHTMSPGG